jgi:hypothetical protein
MWYINTTFQKIDAMYRGGRSPTYKEYQRNWVLSSRICGMVHDQFEESDAVKCQGQNSVSLGFMAVLQAH